MDQTAKILLPKARSDTLFVLLKHEAVEVRIVGLVTYSKFCDREGAAIKSVRYVGG